MRADREDHVGPEPLQVRRAGLLPQVREGDARALGPAAPGGVRQHAGRRRAREHRLRDRSGPAAQGPGPRGGDRGVLADQGGRAGPAHAVPERHHRAVPAPGRLRGRRHHQDGIPGVLPGHRGPHPAREVRRHPMRPRPRVGRGLAGRLRPRHHRPGPDPAQADLRAVPQPGPHLHARHRHGLRRAPARRDDPVHHREVRRGPDRPDHHLLHDQGEGRDQGLGAGALRPARLLGGRPDLEGHAARRHGQGHPAVRGVRREPQAPLRGDRGPRALRDRPAGQGDHGHGAGPGGPEAPVGCARRRRDHVEHAAPRRHPDPAPGGRRRDHHAVRHGRLRDHRAAQDGLPRAAQPHDPRRRSGEHRAQRQARRRPRPSRAGRRDDLRAALPRGHARRVPARRRPDAGPAAADGAQRVRAHLRGRRAVPPRPDGRERAQRLRRPQERPPGGHADPPGARRAAPRGARRDVRPDRLPGTGHVDRAGAGGLHARPGGPAAPRDGQEEEGDPGQGVRLPSPRG